MTLELFNLLPPTVLRNALPLAIGATVLGAMLWAAGARLSRGLFTLIGVAAGGLLGVHLPRWLGWPIENMVTIVIGAMVLGIAGYLLFMTCNSLAFSAILTAGATLAVWSIFRPDGSTGWSWPIINPTDTLPAKLAAVWRSFPAPLDRVIPAAIAGGLSTGVIGAVLWPRAAAIIAHSVIGAALWLGMGTLCLHLVRPTWHAELPQSLAARWAVPLGLVLLGIVVQWRIFPPIAEPVGDNSAKNLGKSSPPIPPITKGRTVSA